MKTAKDILERANSVYYYFVKIPELGAAADELAALLKQSWLSAENRDKVQSLLWRITAKRLALIYFEEGYDGADADAVKDFALQKQKAALEKGYENTARILSDLAMLVERVDKVMRDADEQASKIRTRSWTGVSESAGECRQAEKLFKSKAEEIEKISFPDPLFNKGVKFPDVKSEILRELKKVSDFAAKRAFELECRKNKDIITGARDLRESTDWKYCEYTATTDKSMRLPKTVFLCTPFTDEAELFAVQNSSGPVYLLERETLAGKSAAGLEKSFELFAREGAALLVTGLNGYGGDNKNDIFLALAKYGRSGCRAFIADESGDHELYSQAADVTGAEDICFIYLTMPGFSDVKEFLRERGMISDTAEDMKFVRENLAFMGYVGLNRAVQARTRDKDWKKEALAVVRGRAEKARRYIEKLPTQSQLLDSGWGDYSEMVKGAPGAKAEFSYDDVAHVDRENIRKIMNAPVTFYQRCGLLATYCCGAGSDLSAWESTDMAEKQNRVALATRLLLRAMGVTVNGRVEFHDRIPGASAANGVCCNGGQVIKYRTGLLRKKFEETVHTVAHECMHALQFQAKNAGWSGWMFSDLGVTSSRVEEWSLNYDHLIDKPYEAYRNQILEADADAFAYDCVRAIADVWHTVDLT